MLIKLLIAWAVMAACVAIHALATKLIVRYVVRPHLAIDRRDHSVTWLLIVLVTCFAVVHLMEVALWAGLYLVADIMPDVETAVYFSAITYTTVGFGDVVLPQGWRLLAGIEGLTGILLVGWTSAVIFYVLTRTNEARELDSAI